MSYELYNFHRANVFDLFERFYLRKRVLFMMGLTVSGNTIGTKWFQAFETATKICIVI